MNYQGVIITGASSGIGAALAQALARPGTRLGLIGRNTERLGAVAAGATARGARVEQGLFDLRDRAALTGFVEGFAAAGPLDLMIANAGVLDGRAPDGAIETAEAARCLLETNLFGAIDTFHAALAPMRSGGGHIVFVASLAGLSPLPDAPAYSASKAALISYGLAMRDALRLQNIRVSVVCPGYVTSQMTQHHLGPKPFEMPADAAAQRILAGIARNKALIGFPFPLYWAARLSIVAPEFIRRWADSGLRFSVAGYAGQGKGGDTTR
jgi:short-subunit dehydrogenase